MATSDKRTLEKQARDAARAPDLRRRRMLRLVGVGLVLALIVGLALAGTGDRERAPQKPAADAPPSLPAGCTAQERDAGEPKTYNEVPELTLDQEVDYAAVIHTSCGDIALDLLEQQAPKTVANFVFLARDGFYDDLIWHRVERNFVIQTGDPNAQNGTPPDGPGYSIPDELEGVRPKDYVFGVVAMANTGQPNTGGSQFFVITHTGPDGKVEPAGLQALYTIFGIVDESSFEVLERIQKVEVKQGNDPVEAVEPVVPIYIDSIEIRES